MHRTYFALFIVGVGGCGVACGLALSGTARDVGNDAATDVAMDDTTNDDASNDASPPGDSGCDPDAACGATPVALVGSGFHFCSQARSGDIYCWGRNGDGELGVGDLLPRARPTRVLRQTDGGSLPSFVEVSAGWMHTCARTSDDAVYCWGQNYYAQAGQPVATARSVTPARVGVLYAGEIAAGGVHTCAIDHSLRVQCWGANADGELGYAPGSRIAMGEMQCASNTFWCNPTPTPTAVAVAPARLALLYASSCTIIADGGVACWGSDRQSELGDMPTVAAVPNAVTLSTDAGPLVGATSVAGTYLSGCASLGDAGAQCWGYNLWGNLGSAPSAAVNPPQPFGTLGNVSAVAVGLAHGCVVASGRVHCAGWNGEGALGNGMVGGDAGCPTFTGGQVPDQCFIGIVDVGLTFVAQIATSATSTCALTANHKIYCWGENQFGQLGHAPGANGDVPCTGTGNSLCNPSPTEVALAP